MKIEVHYEILKGAVEKIESRLNELKTKKELFKVDILPCEEGVLATIKFEIPRGEV